MNSLSNFLEVKINKKDEMVTLRGDDSSICPFVKKIKYILLYLAANFSVKNIL